MALSAKVKKSINIAVRIVVVILSFWFIYKQVFASGNLDLFTMQVMADRWPFYLSLAILLMPVNWFIEAFKWQLLISFIEKVTFVQAVQSVFTGITMSLFTPNRIGEFFGRLLTLKYANPLKGAFLTITGSVSQLMVTLLMGMLALCFYIPAYYDLNEPWNSLIYGSVVVGAILVSSVMVMMFLKVSALSGWSKRIVKPGWRKIRDYLRITRRLKRKLLIKILLLSFTRYMVFSFQFYILLLAFGVSIPILNAFMLISMTYFAMTAIPSIALVDLGIRGSVAIYFIGLYFDHQPGVAVSIMAATTAIWILNLAVPALMGILFIHRLKLIRKEK